MQYQNPDWTSIIRYHLKQKGWTQTQLAHQLRRTTSNVAQLIRRNNPSDVVLQQLSRLFETDLFLYKTSQETQALYQKAVRTGLAQIPEESLNALDLSRATQDHQPSEGAPEKVDDLKARIQELEAELLQEQHARQIEVATLSAKLEVYREMSGRQMPPTNLG